jgi:F420-dependent NADP oxidoreductase-like protein
MEITIIGTGNMARGIATRALAGGHAVTLLGTDGDKARSVAEGLSGDVKAGTVGDPLSGESWCSRSGSRIRCTTYWPVMATSWTARS